MFRPKPSIREEMLLQDIFLLFIHQKLASHPCPNPNIFAYILDALYT